MKSTVLRNILTIAAAVLFVFSAHLHTAGAAEKAAKTTKDTKAAAKAVAQHPDYVIGIEDVIEISVWKNPDLSKTVMVRPDGMISLPLVGELKAAGLTPEQLRDALNVALQEYQETVVTSVIVQEVNSYRIFILGEVMSPGTYTMTRRMSVIQAIALAGGFNPFASRKIVLVRENGNSMAEKIEIRFDDIIDTDARRDKNLILKPGDTVFVQ
ncbi:MAG: polysaccharide biosynthesis/export family protein [Deltaproteobacteria bacterium]|nr:polysaccharide biosynthesis/export family protein [Deltaproteobacteria bacterium]